MTAIQFSSLTDVAAYLHRLLPESESLSDDTIRDLFHASGIAYGEVLDRDDADDVATLDALYDAALDALLTGADRAATTIEFIGAGGWVLDTMTVPAPGVRTEAEDAELRARALAHAAFLARENGEDVTIRWEAGAGAEGEPDTLITLEDALTATT